MKLAEALALRAEATRRIEQLRGRIIDNARYQEGEDAATLLAQTGEADLLDEIKNGRSR